MFVGECVICGIAPCFSKGVSENSSQGINYNLLLLCLRTCEFRYSSSHSSVDEIFHNENNFMNELCRNCETAASRLISIYLQVNSLLQELEQLKSNVKTDVENACRPKLDAGLEAGHNEERLSERTTSIRREISSALGVTEEKIVDKSKSYPASLDNTPLDARYVFEDELRANPIKAEEELVTDCHDDNPMETSSNHSDNKLDERDSWSHLRQLHGVKDCSVRLDRLTSKEIADWTSRIAPHKKIRRSKIENSARKKIRRGLLGKRIYCGFPLCSRFMFKAEDLERHKILKHGLQTNLSEAGRKVLEKYRYRCLEPHCSFVGLTERSIKFHATVKHATIPTDSTVHVKDPTENALAKCDQPGCSLAFRTTLSLKRHKKAIHDVEGDSHSGQKLIRYCCDVPGCKSSSYSQIRLNAHKAKVHENVSHFYKCDKCGRCLNNLQSYRMHLKAIHGGTKDAVCHICGKAFAVEEYLKFHMRMHNPPKVKCRFCPKVYSNATARAHHERAVHTGERPYVCDRCGKDFISVRGLTKHVGAIHNKDVRPYVCQICGKDYPIHDYLRMHYMNSHKGHRIPGSKESLRQPELPPTTRTEPAISVAEGCNGISSTMTTSNKSSQ